MLEIISTWKINTQLFFQDCMHNGVLYAFCILSYYASEASTCMQPCKLLYMCPNYKAGCYHRVTFHMEHHEGHRATFLPWGKATQAIHVSGSLTHMWVHFSIIQCLWWKWYVGLKWNLERKCKEVTRPEKSYLLMSSIHSKTDRSKHLRIYFQVGESCRFPGLR